MTRGAKQRPRQGERSGGRVLGSTNCGCGVPTDPQMLRSFADTASALLEGYASQPQRKREAVVVAALRQGPLASCLFLVSCSAAASWRRLPQPHLAAVSPGDAPARRALVELAAAAAQLEQDEADADYSRALLHHNVRAALAPRVMRHSAGVRLADCKEGVLVGPAGGAHPAGRAGGQASRA